MMPSIGKGAAAQKAQEAFDKQLEKAVRLQDALSEANAAVQAAEEDRARLAQERYRAWYRLATSLLPRTNALASSGVCMPLSRRV